MFVPVHIERLALLTAYLPFEICPNSVRLTEIEGDWSSMSLVDARRQASCDVSADQYSSIRGAISPQKVRSGIVGMCILLDDREPFE